MQLSLFAKQVSILGPIIQTQLSFDVAARGGKKSTLLLKFEGKTIPNFELRSESGMHECCDEKENSQKCR